MWQGGCVGLGRRGAEYGCAAPVTSTRYVMADHLGSAPVVMDGAGGVTGHGAAIVLWPQIAWRPW